MPQALTVAWLDFRRDDILRARSFLRTMGEEGVIDELGFLSLQGRYADIFYPATSTLMRAARYLYFVAGIYRQLEREGISSRHIDDESRRRMNDLRDVLARNEKVGVFGRDAGMDLKQFPSSVYWSALRQLAIFAVSSLSEAGYHAQFDELAAQRRGFQDDDKTKLSVSAVAFWDELPAATFMDGRGKIRPETDFRMTPEEGDDLESRFEAQFPKSLIVHLLRNRVTGLEAPWHLPSPPPHLRTSLGHAHALSAFARGTTLQYYDVVRAERAGRKLDISDTNLLSYFEAWWNAERRGLLHWDVQEFERSPDIAGTVRPRDIAFITSWLDRLRECSHAEAMLADHQARQSVRRRELDIKPGKARLKYVSQLVRWREPRLSNATWQLDYRHHIGSRFVREILAARRRSS